jgi:hypothetical protein
MEDCLCHAVEAGIGAELLVITLLELDNIGVVDVSWSVVRLKYSA